MVTIAAGGVRAEVGDGGAHGGVGGEEGHAAEGDGDK